MVEEVTFESVNELNDENTDENYLKLCMNECLRIEPPVGHSSSFCMTEDCMVGGIKIRKGEQIMLNMH